MVPACRVAEEAHSIAPGPAIHPRPGGYRAHRDHLSHLFTWCTRALLALGFLPSGLTKLLGHRFTTLSPDGLR